MTLSHMLSLLAGFVGARFAGAALGFVSQVVLARLLAPADVGIVLMAMSIAAFVSLLIVGGYSMLAMTQLPKLATHGRQNLLRSFHRVALTDGLLLYFVVLGLLALISLVVPLTEGQRMAWLFGCLCAPAASLIRYNGTAATTNRQFKLAYVPDFIIRPGLFLLFLLVAYVMFVHVDKRIVLFVFFGLGLAVAIGQNMMLGNVGFSWGDIGPSRASLAWLLRWRAGALTVVAAASYAAADILTIIAGMILPESDVAVAGIAVRLAAVAGFVLQAGQMFVLPDFTQSLVRRDQKTVNTLLGRINTITLVIIFGSLLACAVLGTYVLQLFGAQYAQGEALLMLMMVGQAIRAFGGMNQHVLSVNGYQLRTAGACLFTLAVLVLLSVVLCRFFGLVGLGYATVIAELVWVIALAAQAQSLCGWRADPLWLMRHGRNTTS